MASVMMERALECPAEPAWALLADVAAPHKAFPGVLTDAHIDGDTRVVTFANGMVVRERIVSVDPSRRRVAYAVVTPALTGAPLGQGGVTVAGRGSPRRG